MSKKKEIVELLKEDTDIEEICTDLGVSTSYVYRIKREMEESEGDKKEANDSEKGTTDAVVIDPSGGDSPNVERDSKDLESKEDKGKADKPDRVGGIKKRRRKKVKKEEEEEEEEDNGGLIKWIKKKWKQMLLTLTLLILLIIAMFASSRKESIEQTPNMQERESRFPIIKI